jgi:cytochrome c oxidase subunit II
MNDPTRRAFLARSATLLCAPVGVVALAQADTPEAQPLDIVAKKFEYVPQRIVARKGQPLLLRFTAPEVPMGVQFSDFGVRADILPGRPTLLRFTPDRAGSFTFHCDVFCGSGHEDMAGMLLVSE